MEGLLVLLGVLFHAWALQIAVGMVGRKSTFLTAIGATVVFTLVDAVLFTNGLGILALPVNLWITHGFFKAGCGGSLLILFIGMLVRFGLAVLIALAVGATLGGLALF